MGCVREPRSEIRQLMAKVDSPGTLARRIGRGAVDVDAQDVLGAERLIQRKELRLAQHCAVTSVVG
jgi:hypothetical protein